MFKLFDRGGEEHSFSSKEALLQSLVDSIPEGVSFSDILLDIYSGSEHEDMQMAVLLAHGNAQDDAPDQNPKTTTHPKSTVVDKRVASHPSFHRAIWFPCQEWATMWREDRTLLKEIAFDDFQQQWPAGIMAVDTSASEEVMSAASLYGTGESNQR